MKIVDKRNKATMFEELRIGEVFCSNGAYFTKISRVIDKVCHLERNAIRLDTGDAWLFENRYVEVVGAEVVIR